MQRRAKDENGKSITVPANMNYSDWKEKYIDNSDNKLPYKDVTDTILTKNKKEYKVEEQQYFIDEKGTKYEIDGRSVKIKANAKEREVAELLGKIFGGQVKLIPVVLNPKGIKTPDYIVNNIKFDLKEPTGSSKTTIYDLFKHKSKQADNYIVDIHKSKLDRLEAVEQTQKLFYSKHRKWIDTIILMEDDEVFKILKRK